MIFQCYLSYTEEFTYYNFIRTLRLVSLYYRGGKPDRYDENYIKNGHYNSPNVLQICKYIPNL